MVWENDLLEFVNATSILVEILYLTSHIHTTLEFQLNDRYLSLTDDILNNSSKLNVCSKYPA